VSDQDLAARAAFVVELAREAGDLAQRYFIRELDYAAESKGPQDWVSVADRAVEARIRTTLARAFPDDAMLGEETGGEGGRAERLWVVDPIDGTLNFVHGIRYWCVSIAYVEHGRRQLGAIYDPSADELFLGVAGGEATCNGRPIHVSRCTALDQALVAAGYVPRHGLDTHLALRRALFEAGAAVKDMGAGALMLAHVAAGRFDAFVEPHMHPWDAVAGLTLIEAAGGRVAPYPGPAGLAAGGAVVAAAPGVFVALSGNRWFPGNE
jgi:myo-inositol-1(or 4)-monophosphatase